MTIPLSALAALFAVAVVGAVHAVLQVRDARRREAGLRQRLETMEAAVRASCAAQARVGDRLIDVECESRRIAASVARLDLRAPGGGAYRQAEALAARGAGSEELVEACGIGHEEAALLCLLHRKEPGESPIEGSIESIH